jgi:hypothetical protein
MTTLMMPLGRLMVQGAVMATWDIRSQNWLVGLPLTSYFSLSWGTQPWKEWGNFLKL